MITVDLRPPTDIAASLYASLAMGAWQRNGETSPTSGAYPFWPVSYSATGALPIVLPRLAAKEESLTQVPPTAVMGTAPTGVFVFARGTSSEVSDGPLALLKAAADAGDERAFLAAKSMINWSIRPADDFVQAVRLALAAGAHLAARNLSAEGATRFPDHNLLQKYAHVLSPPKTIRRHLPPDPTLAANRDWLMANGDHYRRQWVALRNGVLLGSAPSLKTLIEQVSVAPGILFTRVY
jgi:hypothetical protein